MDIFHNLFFTEHKAYNCDFDFLHQDENKDNNNEKIDEITKNSY